VVKRYFIKQGGDAVVPPAPFGHIAEIPVAHAAQTNEIAQGASASQLHAPDFSGRWLLDRIDGDCEALLVDAGTSWPLRKLAKSMKYGVGKAVQDVQQDGDSFVVVSETGVKTTTMRFSAGAGDQEIMGPDGTPAVARTHWERDVLHMSFRKPNGAKLPSVSRRIVGSEMVMEATTSKGDVVRRYFIRQGQIPAPSLSASSDLREPHNMDAAAYLGASVNSRSAPRIRVAPVQCATDAQCSEGRGLAVVDARPSGSQQVGQSPVAYDPAMIAIETMAVEAIFGWL